MEETKPKKFYPLLSVRISEEQMSNLRRWAKERSVKVPEYVRTILFPFELPDDK